MDDALRAHNLLGAFAVGVGDRLRARAEEVVGLGGAAPAALVTIAQLPGGTVEELRQAIGLSHPAAVRVVDRLVAAGLVTRRLKGRGPAVALTATAAGRRRALRALDAREEVLAESFAPLDAAEAAGLTRALEQALAALASSPRTTVCRLCDMDRCRRGDCPVETAQVQLGVPPPPHTPLRSRR
jgi:DNA-binding MarR family transcriptional regulator